MNAQPNTLIQDAIAELIADEIGVDFDAFQTGLKKLESTIQGIASDVDEMRVKGAAQLLREASSADADNSYLYTFILVAIGFAAQLSGKPEASLFHRVRGRVDFLERRIAERGS
jgi:hypothetical protein